MNIFDFKPPQDRQTNTSQPFPTDNIFLTMNSFDFKPPKDRQTDTGDSGEAPQHFPIENIFFTSNRHTQTDRHIVQTATGHTDAGFYIKKYDQS